MPVVYFHATLLSSGNLAQDTTIGSQSIKQELSSEEQLTLINEQLPYEKEVYSNTSAHSDAFTEENTNDIHIYPNPTDKNVQVTVDHIASGKYYLYDALGKVVMEGSAQAKFDLNLEKLEKGLYLLIVKTEEQTFQAKIIKS